MIGQFDLNIPPKVSMHSEIGSCDSECTNEIITGDVIVTEALNHMHLLGTYFIKVSGLSLTPPVQKCLF